MPYRLFFSCYLIFSTTKLNTTTYNIIIFLLLNKTQHTDYNLNLVSQGLFTRKNMSINYTEFQFSDLSYLVYLFIICIMSNPKQFMIFSYIRKKFQYTESRQQNIMVSYGLKK